MAAKKAAKKAPAKKAAAKKTTKPKSDKPKAVRADAVIQNDVTKPRDGTGSAKVWEIADKISKATKAPATRGAVMEAAEKAGVNPATASTQYGRWRQFNGVVGRLESPAE